MCYKLTTSLLLISTFSLIGCFDKSPVGPGDQLPPDLPALADLQLLQPNLEFFDSETIESELEDTTAYKLASYLVHSELNPFVQGIFTYQPFLEGANQSEPESKRGGWEWNYSHTHEELDYGVRLTYQKAAEDDDYTSISWTLYVSTSQNQEEPLENYKLMELSIHMDGSSGSWVIYPPEYQETDANFSPYLMLYWERYNSNYEEYYYDFQPYSPNSNEQIQAGYIKDDNSNFEFNRQINMFIENAEFEGKIFNIAWNNNTNVGFLNLEGNLGGEISLTICWDENFNDTECQF